MKLRQLLGFILTTAVFTSYTSAQEYPERAQNAFPEFSWDRVPVSAHFGIGDGLKPEQYDFLAKHFNFITLTAGRLSRDSESSAELQTAEAARAIKKRNPKAKVLFYWASDKPKHQSKISNEAYPGDYLIHTQPVKDGKDITTKYFDITRKEVQDWWTDAAVNAVTKYSCDGIYVDGLTAGSPGGPFSRDFGDEQAAAMYRATFVMLKDVRRKMGPDKLILFNPIHGADESRAPIGLDLLPLTDGGMLDDFDRLRLQDKEYMVNTIETMREGAKNGKIMIFKGWPRFLRAWRDGKMKGIPHEEVLQAAQKDITFSLASFLVGAEPNCYFCYSWGWNPEEGSLDWYPEFDKPLGLPKGPAERDGFTYHREFIHASVCVDLEKRTARIDWR